MASLPPLQPATSGSRTQDMMMEDKNTAWMGTVARIIFRQKPCLGSGGAPGPRSILASPLEEAGGHSGAAFRSRHTSHQAWRHSSRKLRLQLLIAKPPPISQSYWQMGA